MCFKCFIKKKYDKENLIKNVYWCKFCGKYFKKWESFKKHMDNHELNNI
jgi:hypothetical protein